VGVGAGGRWENWNVFTMALLVQPEYRATFPEEDQLVRFAFP
jgi:hypothetical protein